MAPLGPWREAENPDNNRTGTMSDSAGKPRPITKGSLDGDKISLTMASEYQGNPMTLPVTAQFPATL
jgi:hypothetical protein